MDEVRTSTSGVTTELTIVPAEKLLVDSTVPNVTDRSGKTALSVIQLTTVTGDGHCCFFCKSAGAAVTVSACTMVSHIVDFIVADDLRNENRTKMGGEKKRGRKP